LYQQRESARRKNLAIRRFDDAATEAEDISQGWDCPGASI